MNSTIDSEKIIILDFGSQYTQLIARRIRELGVYSEILSCNTSYRNILKTNPKGIIISGGPESVNTKNTLKTGLWYNPSKTWVAWNKQLGYIKLTEDWICELDD